MALSYSNIEACQVKLGAEKAPEIQDVNPDIGSKKHLGPWHLIQLVLHIVSFATMIWLVVQVLRLQTESVQLNAVNFRQSRVTTVNSSDPTNYHTRSYNNDDRSRIRRQISDDSMDMSSSDYYSNCCNGNCCDAIPSFHVTGIQQPESGNWFSFHTSMDAAFSKYSHENLQFVHNKFFEVLVPGYYFVYSQICYKVASSLTYGHEVVVSPDCGNGDSFTILRVKSTHITEPSEPDNTGYTGGVFYLAANDRLGVRPLQSQSVTLDYQDSVAQTSYFGAFLLAKDMHVEVNPDLSPCT